MTQEEVSRACDIVCENCNRKTCYDCVVDEVKNNTLQECIDDGCPDENFFDDEDAVYPDPSEDVWDDMV